MRIGIYLKDFNPEEGGASTFSRQIIKELDVLQKEYELSICFRGRIFDRAVWDENGIQYVNICGYKRKRYFYFLFSMVKLAARRLGRWLALKADIKENVSVLDRMAEELHIDIYWFTFPSFEMLSTPYIYTLWDLGHRLLPLPELTRPINGWLGRETLFHEMLSRAAYIMVGNQAGKEEVLLNYKVMPDRIRIAPFEMPRLNEEEEKIPDRELPSDFFFYPAQFWPHKNHICILDALLILKEEHGLRPAVLFTGSDKGNLDYVKRKTLEYGLENQIHFLGFVNSGELRYLYRHAKGLIFASLLGPDNLPPLEALSVGCPVIITDLKGHVEQLGKVAWYFDGMSPESLADVMVRFLAQEEGWDECMMNRKTVMDDLRENFVSYRYITVIEEVLSEFRKVRRLWEDG